MVAEVDSSFLESLKNVDLRAEKDHAVFWSNDFRPDIVGIPRPRNKQLAEERTQDGNHQVIKNKIPVIDEMWIKGFKFNGQEVSLAAKTKASAELSQAFAEQASGTVTIYANYTGATSFFRGNELLALMVNDKVTNVDFLDTQDNKKTLPKIDWYNWQRNQFVDGRIEKLNDTNKAWKEQTAKWTASHKDGEKAPEPNDYAVGDFANEMATAYRNIAMGNNPNHIDPVKEQGYANKLQKALQNIDNPALHNRVIEKIKEVLKDDNEKVKALFANSVETSVVDAKKLYTIKAGDTLLSVAELNFGSKDKVAGFMAIREANPQIVNPNDVKVGETLIMPTASQLTKSILALDKVMESNSVGDSVVIYNKELPKIIPSTVQVSK
ncbi:MAG: LysM peptidoglycan-binding domain-containing protein [Rickettsiales bacterium]